MSADIEKALAPATSATGIYEFDEDFQTKIAALLLRDTTFAGRTEGLIAPEYFMSDAEAALVRIGIDYVEKYKKAPDRSLWGELIKDAITTKRLRRDMVTDVRDAAKVLLGADISDRDIVVEKVAEFARSRAVENALMKSVDLHEKRDFTKIGQLIKEAMDVGASEEEGDYDFADEVDSRTEIRKAKLAGTYAHDGITTGYKEMDGLLYHRGWGRKELSVLMAPAKGGKSMGLADFGVNAWIAGYNVLYVTLEVSKEITSDRMDANLSDTMMKELTTSPFKVAERIKELKSKTKGVLKIREYPTGSLKPSGLRRLIEYYRRKGINFDLIIVDYADIMAPERWTDSVTENSKSIYVDLRAIMQEYGAAGLTATQTNREGAKAVTATGTDIAEDFNKVRIADIILSINATLAEKAAGEARIFFAVVRNGEDGFTLRIKQNRSKMRFITKIEGRE